MAHSGEARLDRFRLFRLPRGPLPNFEVLNDRCGETQSAGWGRSLPNGIANDSAGVGQKR